MTNLVITLKDEDLMELQRLLMDEDTGAALDFLRTRIASQVPGKGAGHCDSSRLNPFLMKPDPGK
jgi:hypothetical protein